MGSYPTNEHFILYNPGFKFSNLKFPSKSLATLNLIAQ